MFTTTKCLALSWGIVGLAPMLPTLAQRSIGVLKDRVLAPLSSSTPIDGSRESTFLACYAGQDPLRGEAGDNDEYASLSARFGSPNYGVGSHDVSARGQYDLEFTIKQVEVIQP